MVLLEAKEFILNNINVQNKQLEANLILQEVLNFSLTDVIVKSNYSVLEDYIEKIKNIINRRNKGEPLAYIFGYKDFWDYKFIVNKNVLIPRPETEGIIEATLKYFVDKNKNLSILDLGVGSGCIFITLLKHYQNSNAVGVDVSAKALEVAEQNSKKLNIDTRSKLIKADFLNGFKTESSFDLIVSNPPYIAKGDNLLEENVKIFEPNEALFAENNGLYFYEEIFTKGNPLLKETGKIIVEIGLEQQKDIELIIKANNLVVVEVIKDLNNIPRIMVVSK